MTGSNPSKPSGGSSGGSGARSVSSMIGRVLGSDFELRSEIGRGGMGTVYEARQISLDRVVAVKVLAGSLGLGGNAIVRFQREAQAAAKLHHNSIVPIYAHGEDDGLYYYAMQLVEGRSVIEVINEARGGDGSIGGSLSETRLIVGRSSDGDTARELNDDPDATVRVSSQADTSSSGSVSRTARRDTAKYDEIAELVATAADGLEYAHRHGVIHRDIKPHNLIHGTEGQLCIADFGLARVLEQPGVTTTGEFIGSPLYMSPEQISGGRVPVDHRTDLYSLGATLYEWLTLIPPFPGETREQVISSIVRFELTPPRVREPTIPVDLETICLRALEKDPIRRYGSAGEMSADLRRFVRRETIRAKRAGLLSRVRRKIASNRASAVLVAVVFAVLATAYAMVARTERAGQQAVIALQDTVVTLEERNELNESVMELLRENVPVSLESEALRLGGDLFSGLAKRIAAMGKAGGGVDATLNVALNAALETVHTDEDRLLVADLATELIGRLRESAARAASPTSGGPAAMEADGYYRDALDQPDRDEALKLVNLALVKDPFHFESWYLHALIHAHVYDVATLREGADLMLGVKPSHAAGYIVRGMADLIEGLYAASGVAFVHAVEYDPRMPGVHVALGATYARIGKFEKAFDCIDTALALSPSHSFAEHERELGMGLVRKTLDRLSLFIVGAPDDPAQYDTYMRRGELHVLLGEYELAVADYNYARKLNSTPSASWSFSYWVAFSKLNERRSNVGDGGRSVAPSAVAPPAPPVPKPAIEKIGATSSSLSPTRWGRFVVARFAAGR